MAVSPACWADEPFALISIPGCGMDLSKAHASVHVAREMAFAHNGMIRALNSIYQQCIHVSTLIDIADLLKYAQFWCQWLREHHHGEEELLFPQIEKITGEKGLMERNVAQHHAFESGLVKFETWLNDSKPENYHGKELRALIDSFGKILIQHLTEEIQTLLALGQYDGQALKEAWTVFDLEMRKGDKSIIFPIVLGSSDREFEGAGDWPEVPGVVRILVHYYFERKHRGAWRFSPSTTWGNKRPLTFTGDSEI
ncbi:uncharacterized protein TRIVIDRAFT_192611 [Trichoderma virens Gv29-8]|uniref:Hemerythrin-like domain-containing protein n=1 Tax=Hypocrea virens (strain Gv29-8 / FGSC 10586) TaxID=413071 RepID=G9MXR9_HYPVG|nr:uncharacterized protein TRIVIDRAFT_192611 [Trichoderma virens Gv29-8]EHK20680.1 hypothetical protein TRIVIDRAFT_192611 [Trichoderma virens Gv29-8]UKZ56971.1 hypothetical protein TrVGV298_010819 [Trichoderma virens]